VRCSYLGEKFGDPPALYADSTKAQKELDWKPVHTSTDSIVASAVKWHQGHPEGFKR
jgi:UDP-glucose 4-epimerase